MGGCLFIKHDAKEISFILQLKNIIYCKLLEEF